jgi:rod shape-determining protein MreB and related proteins
VPNTFGPFEQTVIMLPFLQNKSFAIDLGNNNTLVTDENKILLSQPSYIVFDEEKHAVKAVGEEAYNIFEKNHNQLKPVKPLRWGVIADYDSASLMINKMVRQVYKKNWLSSFHHIISGVPLCTTEVERRALRDALDQFNSKKTYLLFEPLAAALGMGLNIREPEGKMVIDIGGGITEIVVISLSGVAVFQSIKVAGDLFTEDIQDHFRRVHNLTIGWKTAEQVKVQVGAATPFLKDSPPPMMVRGKGIMEGIPVTRKINHEEIAQVLDKSIQAIEQSIIQTLEVCPPELAADIYQNGVHLTGGSALLRGLSERLQKAIQLPVHLDETPLLSVSKGVSQALRDPKKFKSVLFE